MSFADDSAIQREAQLSGILRAAIEKIAQITAAVNTYIIDHYNPSVGIIDLVSDTTYVV